jgi:enoyl-CoA hydratase
MSDRYGRYEYLDIAVDDGIAMITFNRPEKLNACDRSGHTELAAILRDLHGDDDVRVAVVTGKGRAFSVGGDLSLVEELSEYNPKRTLDLMREAREILQSHIDFDKPIVAAINGVAMGANLAFGLLCDYIIMERQARLADGHIRAALTAGDGGTVIWPLAMGLTRAKKYLLTGDWIDAVEAERVGLVTELADEGRSLERALEVARRLADGPQLAIRTTKMALNQWLRLGQLASFDQSLALEFLIARDEGVRNAVSNVRQGGVGAIAQESPRS